MVEYTEKDTIKSLAKAIELLTEENKELRQELRGFSGLLINYAASKDIHVAVRGLRAVTDFEYELQLAQTNRQLSHEKLDTVFLTTSLEYAYLSSSGVKEIAYFGGDVSPCVPEFVEKLIQEKYKGRA